MLSFQPRNNLHKKKQKLEQTCQIKTHMYTGNQFQILLKKRVRQGTVRVKSMIEEKSARKDSKSYSISLS